MPYDDTPSIGLNQDIITLSNDNSDNDISNIIDIDKFINIALNQIYNDNDIFINHTLFYIANTVLQHAINSTFNQTSKEFIQKNQQFINQFKFNTGVFAAFKAHNQTQLIKDKLIDDFGNLRSFSDFKKNVQDIVSHHNKDWLQTEYNTAVRSARMAANWKQIEATKHIYPNIEFVQSRSVQKDPDHLRLVGTIRPIDDPFWKIFTPPLRWNCKCSIRPTRKDPTPIPADLPPVDPEFQFNPGADAMFVNINNHPYKSQLNKQQALKVYNWYLKNQNINLENLK